MGKRGQKTTRKKGEFYFNFNQLRRKLNSKQKEKLIKFFGKFRSMFLTVKEHLFQVNKMYDLMEQEYKNFQKDLFKDDEYLSGPNQNNEDEQNENNAQKEEEFLLDDDIMRQILDEGLKDENEKENKEEIQNTNKDNIIDKDLLEKYDIDLGKDFFSKKNEKNKKEGNIKENDNEKKENNEYSQEFLEWRKKINK